MVVIPMKPQLHIELPGVGGGGTEGSSGLGLGW